MSTCSFDLIAEEEIEAPTLIEGLPGHGLVASIAVDRIASELGLEPYGGIHADEVPPVLSFSEGLVRDTVRVYAGRDPDVLTLHGDIMLPQEFHRPFSRCVLQDLAERISRGIFLAAAPAQSEKDHGEILGVATNDHMRARLEDAGVALAPGDGLVGGITGALVDECFQRDIPAALVLVRADPHVPDPAAARVVIDDALESLIGFDIDTEPLTEQAKQIQERKAQIAQQLEEADGGTDTESPSVSGMFQ